jgi:hypothetical protein
MSLDALGLFIAFIVMIAQFLAIRGRSAPLKLMGAFSWLIPLVYVKFATIDGITDGSTLQNVLMLIFIGLLLIESFWAFSRNTTVTDSKEFNGGMRNISKEHSEWKLPGWISGLKGESYTEMRRKRMGNIEEYRNRVHRALNPDGINNRRRR